MRMAAQHLLLAFLAIFRVAAQTTCTDTPGAFGSIDPGLTASARSSGLWPGLAGLTNPDIIGFLVPTMSVPPKQTLAPTQLRLSKPSSDRRYYNKGTYGFIVGWNIPSTFNAVQRHPQSRHP